MLRVNQLSGFGPQSAFRPSVQTGSDTNTNSPSFSIDLGGDGVKQVICVLACQDNVGSDPWDFGTGTVGGESFTYAIASGEENAGNGTDFTAGVTIRAIQTSLTGTQTVTIPIVGFTGVMTNNRFMVIVARGISTTPISQDSGDNETGANGDNFTISTVGAKIVVGGCVGETAPGVMTGPGNPITAVEGTFPSIGYDLSPAGGAADVYSFAGGKYVIAGASFG
jgi:hypothetical protein